MRTSRHEDNADHTARQYWQCRQCKKCRQYTDLQTIQTIPKNSYITQRSFAISCDVFFFRLCFIIYPILSNISNASDVNDGICAPFGPSFPHSHRRLPHVDHIWARQQGGEDVTPFNQLHHSSSLSQLKSFIVSNTQAGSMVALLLFRLFGLRLTFLVSSAGLVAVDLAYLLLYHVYLKRSSDYDLDEC